MSLDLSHFDPYLTGFWLYVVPVTNEFVMVESHFLSTFPLKYYMYRDVQGSTIIEKKLNTVYRRSMGTCIFQLLNDPDK